MFGRDPTSMTHLETLGGYEPSGYERYLSQRLASLKEFVERHRVEAQRRQKEYYDKGSKVYECSKFTVGKPVLLSIPRMGVNSKLKDRWEGGLRVIVVIGRCYTEEIMIGIY